MHQNPASAETSTLYVVATPLGNLRDVTLRALDILGSVDWVAAEDTRVTARLLGHYGLKPRLFAVHEHNEYAAVQKVLQLLADGASIALASDAGTPAISDPGAALVAAVREAGYRVVPLPGPSALTAAMSVAGFRAGPFLFYGFLPSRAKARREALHVLREARSAIVFYEAPHRVRAMISALVSLFDGERRMLIARELTKIFETIVVCRLSEALSWLDADANRERGEFVIAIEAPAEPATASPTIDLERTLTLLLSALPLKQAVRLAAQITGAPRNAIYQRALELKRGTGE